MNIGDLFDSPLKVLIIAIVVLVLFGSRKMPDAARSLGRSMRILKSEVSKIHDDDDQPEPAPQAQALTAPTPVGRFQMRVVGLGRPAVFIRGSTVARTDPGAGR